MRRSGVLARACVALGLIGISVVGATSRAVGAVPHTANAGDSAVTVSGKGAFADLKVTVSQTKGLINQVVNVSWTGGTQTQPSTRFGDNYLQVMQCWGDEPSGPSREQCEFGAFGGDSRATSSQPPTRQVISTVPDPLETLLPTDQVPVPYVPFRSATGVTVSGADSDQFFDQQTTNEQPFNRTNADGTGQTYFEMLTAREAPGLGCGTPLTATDGSSAPRGCWLVVVPRGGTDTDGSTVNPDGAGMQTSPLSASNWANRIVIPLDFLQIGVVCPLGSPEVPTDGQEEVEEAISRWQPALCGANSTIYGYSQVSDESARRRVLSTSPAMGFVNNPVPPSQVPDGTNLVYAPVVASAAVIAFNLDSHAVSAVSPPDVLAAEGQRVTDLNLTPRLVAKLLTQSYASGAPPDDPAVANNPGYLSRTPTSSPSIRNSPIGR